MIVTFAHYKGGTGKTTSCLNIAGFLARQGNTVLVVDLDAGGNATSGLGIDKATLDTTMYHVMRPRGKKLRSIIVRTEVERLHLAPTDHKLGYLNLSRYTGKKDAFILAHALNDVKNYYDFILVDTPPVYGHFIINGMAAADKVVIVLDPGVFALEGIATLQQSYRDFFKKLQRPLPIAMALVTKYRRNWNPFAHNHALDIMQETEQLLNKKVYKIPYSDFVFESHARGIPISHYRPRSALGKAYKKIATILQRDLHKERVA